MCLTKRWAQILRRQSQEFLIESRKTTLQNYNYLLHKCCVWKVRWTWGSWLLMTMTLKGSLSLSSLKTGSQPFCQDFMEASHEKQVLSAKEEELTDITAWRWWWRLSWSREEGGGTLLCQTTCSLSFHDVSLKEQVVVSSPFKPNNMSSRDMIREATCSSSSL